MSLATRALEMAVVDAILKNGDIRAADLNLRTHLAASVRKPVPQGAIVEMRKLGWLEAFPNPHTYSKSWERISAELKRNGVFWTDEKANTFAVGGVLIADLRSTVTQSNRTAAPQIYLPEDSLEIIETCVTNPNDILTRFPRLNTPLYSPLIVLVGLMLASGCRPQTLNGWVHGETRTLGSRTITLVRDNPNIKGPELRPIPRTGQWGDHYATFGGDMKHRCSWIEDKPFLVSYGAFVTALQSDAVQNRLPLNHTDYRKLEKVVQTLFRNGSLSAKCARPIYVAIGHRIFSEQGESVELWARRSLGHCSGRTSLVHYNKFVWSPPEGETEFESAY